MDSKRLKQCIKEVEIQRQILGGFKGEFAIGISRLPQQPGGPQLIVYVDATEGDFAESVTVDGETIPVVIRYGFRSPRM